MSESSSYRKLQEIGVEEIKIIEVKDRVYNNQVLGCDVSIETENEIRY